MYTAKEALYVRIFSSCLSGCFKVLFFFLQALLLFNPISRLSETLVILGTLLIVNEYWNATVARLGGWSTRVQESLSDVEVLRLRRSERSLN